MSSKLSRYFKILFTLALIACVILSLFLLFPAIRAHADGPLHDVDHPVDTTPIYTAEDLLAMADNPSATYELMNDIDMKGVKWKPFSFSGTLNGNGYAILNLTITEAGEGMMQTIDGNRKVYDTTFCAMFDILSGSVVNLNLLNIQVNHTSDQPVFVGSIAGYLDGGTIANCDIEGQLMLKAHDRMFGVGGIAGFGHGMFMICNADVTLICIDTDKGTRDEQFMGGVCAAGYPDIKECKIVIDGYDSDHGYVHNGGLVGMYIFYGEEGYEGSIAENNVKGKITFYEDNTNRRAYCKAFIGEIMNYVFWDEDNTEEFIRDEVYCYDIDLMPMKSELPRENPLTENCDHKEKSEVIAPKCQEFGYTKHTCEICGYEWKDDYTLKEHSFEWNMIKEPTVDEEGINQGICTLCGETVEEPIPKLTEEEYMAIAEEETSEISVDDENRMTLLERLKEKNYLLLGFIALGAAAILGIGATLIRITRGKK
jgi:hypothetical protein